MKLKVIYRRARWIVLPLIAWALSFPSHGHADDPEEILIVANRKCSRSSMTLNQARSIFLKQQSSWGTGKRAHPFNAKRGSEARRAFQQRVLGMDSAMEDTYWQEMQITKGITPPPEFSNILKAVFSVDGSIGYVHRKDYKEGVVKILLVVPI
jgi:ABC-type phosphate transport system substrate-binding protein